MFEIKKKLVTGAVDSFVSANKLDGIYRLLCEVNLFFFMIIFLLKISQSKNLICSSMR